MSHISFSELKIWEECAWKHKLTYLDSIKKFEGNEYTAFGSAMHSVCELLISSSVIRPKNYFKEKFLEELKSLPEDYKLNKKLVYDLKHQGVKLVDHVLPAVKKCFGTFKLISVEEKIFEDMPEQLGYKFKGFIDLVIKTQDGKYHVIDWKTCSWGWDERKKSDRMVTYQLTFYKYFFSLKHGIDSDNIETHFALLKRTAKKNNVEIFKVTSGKRKTENALKLLKKAIYNIENKRYIKNRTSCFGKYGKCEFYKTQHCK